MLVQIRPREDGQCCEYCAPEAFASIRAHINSCPIDLASIVLHDARDTSPSQRHVQEAFKSIFDWDGYYEEQQYTEIHRIVLGDLSRDLEEALQELHWEINNLDACGCSALWWSCSRGDVEATRLLLKYGADLNTCDVEGDYPLHATVFSCSSECTTLLLDYGADVNRRDKFGFTPLRSVCHLRDDPNHVKVFLKHGADINLTDTCGRNPLSAAADINAAESIRLLLANGANADLQDDYGLTALHVAIQNNCHEAVQAILEYQTFHRMTTNLGKTALHIAASFGDIAVMECLEKSGLHGSDFLAKDANGMIARDYLRSREDLSPELIRAYNAMEEQVMDAFVKPNDELQHRPQTNQDDEWRRRYSTRHRRVC
jgi:ankyrin repeat protein